MEGIEQSGTAHGASVTELKAFIEKKRARAQNQYTGQLFEANRRPERREFLRTQAELTYAHTLERINRQAGETAEYNPFVSDELARPEFGENPVPRSLAEIQGMHFTTSDLPDTRAAWGRVLPRLHPEQSVLIVRPTEIERTFERYRRALIEGSIDEFPNATVDISTWVVRARIPRRVNYEHVLELPAETFLNQFSFVRLEGPHVSGEGNAERYRDAIRAFRMASEQKDWHLDMFLASTPRGSELRPIHDFVAYSFGAPLVPGRNELAERREQLAAARAQLQTIEEPR
ncbi:hypothetical protein HY374_03055 [Candidatus Berkelbacteria bacterium]|nr:hypothetical protein [Candidatus Berkelbacteria bacterium]